MKKSEKRPVTIPADDGIVDDDDEGDDAEEVGNAVPHHRPPVKVNSLQQSTQRYTRDSFVVVVVVDRCYIALFSALEQTHCARMWFYMSD